jgi:transposase
MSRPMRRTSPNHFIEVRAERLEGAPVGERRRWSDDFKDRAIAASLEPGANISALARSLEITPSQLFSWRGAAARKAEKANVASGAPAELPAISTKTRRVEIEVAGAFVRVSADIAEDDLRRVLRAVREA